MSLSLATYASNFNNNEGFENNPIQKKREGIRNNKTLKRREPLKFNANVESMMKRIHANSDEDEGDEDDGHSSNFQPLSPPDSVGTERIDNGMRQDMEHGMEHRMNTQQNIQPSYYNQSKEGFTQLPSEYAKQYYQQYVPYFNQSSDDTTPNGVNKDEILTKLNQIIYLLEEKQEEKTGNVTEELILYSFLGIFIIFIVDSFARVGKYVR
jgi:hypothetical protein